MKNNLIIISLFITINLCSQEVLNISEEKLKQMYPENNFMTSFTLYENIKYVYTTFGENFYCYYLDSLNYIYRVMVVPREDVAMLPYLRKCNSKYKLIKSIDYDDIDENDGLMRMWRGTLRIGGDTRIRMFLDINQHVYVYDAWNDNL